MQYTNNYNLKKPEGSDIVNIDDLNHNADILDQKLKELENKANEAEANAKDYTDAHASTRNAHVDGYGGYYIAKTSRPDQLPDWNDIMGKPSVYVPIAHKSTHAIGGGDTLTPADIGAETLAGAQAKAEAALYSAKAYTDQEVAVVSQELNTHLAKKVHQEEVHGFRIIDGKLKFFDGSNWAEIEVAGGGVPIGSIIPWTTTTIPDGWLECNGQAVSRTGFSELFAKIGTTFGAGDGSTTFNVPDLRGEFIRGWDHGRGVDSGRVFGSWQADEFKAHDHDLPKDQEGNSTLPTLFNTPNNDESPIGLKTGVTGGPETRPRNVALMYIIKAKDVAGSDPAVQGANADTLDGFHASAFALSGHIHPEYALRYHDHPEYTIGYSLQHYGYCKIANGLIIQWGGGAYASAVTFPIRFPTAVFSVIVNGGGMTNKSGDNAGLCPNNVALTGFTAFNMGDQDFTSMYWTAIGY